MSKYSTNIQSIHERLDRFTDIYWWKKQKKKQRNKNWTIKINRKMKRKRQVYKLANKWQKEIWLIEKRKKIRTE